LNECPNPLDPIDVEALASGEPSPIRSDAREHALACALCHDSVEQSRRFEDLLALEPAAAPIELAQGVLRVRPFSVRERRSLAVWSPPLLLIAALAISGAALVSGVARAGDQIGLAAALAASLAGLARACLRWLADLARTAPGALEALSQTLRPTSIGWAAALLLAPLGFALRRVLSRAFARR
jgi:hypothetical protein